MTEKREPTKKIEKLTNKQLADKLKDLRERRGQAPKDAIKHRRYLKRAEERVIEEQRRRQKLRGE